MLFSHRHDQFISNNKENKLSADEKYFEETMCFVCMINSLLSFHALENVDHRELLCCYLLITAYLESSNLLCFTSLLKYLSWNYVVQAIKPHWKKKYSQKFCVLFKSGRYKW